MIVVIGKSGQLARQLSLIMPHDTVFLGRQDIDITCPDNIETVISQYSPEAVINASAYTAVDKAQTDKDAAYAVNHTGVANLASFCQCHNIHLVHVSTDYVFCGEYHSPINTAEKRMPLGVYGASKAAGEQALETTSSLSYTLLRTAWVYSTFGNNFVLTMLRLMKEKPSLGVVADQIGSPTGADGLALACLHAAGQRVQGHHHWTDLGVASWYDFAIAIQGIGLELGLLEKSIPITPLATSDYPTPARRPAYSVLDKASLPSDFSPVQQMHWQQRLAGMLSTLV